MFRPAQPRILGQPNPVTGRIAQVPNNIYNVLTRKGVLPLAGQPFSTMIIETIARVPAGAEVADPLSVKAAFSLHIGAVWAQASGIGDTAVTGII
jgi:hypothetical protein